MHALFVQIHTGHPWLTAALGFPITGARGNLLEAQHWKGEERESQREAESERGWVPAVSIIQVDPHSPGSQERQSWQMERWFQYSL